MSVVGPLISLIVFVGVIAAIAYAAYAFTRGRAGEAGITFATVISAYVALMVAISTLLIAASGAAFGKVVIAEIAGRDYSYDTLHYDSKPRPIRVEDEHVHPDQAASLSPPSTPSEQVKSVPDDSVSDRQFRNDIADGITFAAFGGVILAAHLAVGRAVRQRVDASHQRLIARALALVMTVIGGIGFLIAGGAGLSQLLRRTILASDLQPSESPPQPGGELGWAMAFLVIWLWFGVLLWREFAADRGD